MKKPDPRVDAYIAKAAPFAQPILKHVRALVHATCPEAEESIKWSFPNFTYRGAILCSMAAFKGHCSFGFWHQGMPAVLAADGIKGEDAMGSMGRLTKLADLPSDAALTRYIKAAVQLQDSGAPARPRPAKPTVRKELVVPPDLAAALKKNKPAAKAFDAFSYSHRKEYIEWITEAKREETRAKRVATALEWIAQGKGRNWKYENC